MRARLSAAVRSGFVSNLLSLYGVQFAKYLLPLVTVPYLTRVLGPSGWGLFAFALGYGAYLSIPVDYGFAFTGAREVARCRDDRDKLSDIFAAVNGAKVALALLCVLVSFGIEYVVEVFRKDPLLLWLGAFSGLAPAFAPNWYFLGMERLKLIAILDLCSRAATTAGIFVLVHSKGDVWKALVLSALGGSIGTASGMALAYRELDLRLPSPSQIWEVMRTGRSMFVSRGANALYTSGNAFLLGLFAPPSVVGFYSGAEKIVRAALQMFQPLYMVLFPKISGLVHRSPRRALTVARRSALVLVASGILGGFLLFAYSPLAVRIFLGRGYEPAVILIRILAILLPVIGINTAMGGLWMVPWGKDRAFEMTVLATGAVDLTLVFLLVPRFYGIGMAFAVVLAEFVCSIMLFLYLDVKKQGFWIRTPELGTSPAPSVSAGKRA